MNILFITASRIGDAILSTGLLDHIAREHPDAKVTIVCGPLAVSLFEGYPLLAEIIPLEKQKRNKHWFDLWKRVVRTQWDVVVDLRNSAVSRLVLADSRYIFGPRIDKNAHKVEQNAAVMKLDYVPVPRLFPSLAQMEKARALIPEGFILAVGPAANWAAKTWPAERFIEIIEWMTGHNGLMPDAPVAVFAAPGEEEAARKVLESVPQDRRVDVIAKADPGTAAAALSLCDFYIGNDSGLMHAAAAAGIPTVGLFGPSYPYLYRPYGPHCTYAATPESFDELIAYEGYESSSAPCLMQSLSVDDVKKKIMELDKSRKAA